MKENGSDLKTINYAGYGIGTFGTSLLSVMVTTYLTVYLTNVAFLDIAAVSAIVAVSKVFDGISDIAAGSIVDRTSSRLGHARVWLLRMCVPFAVTTLLLFRIPPQFSGSAKYVYLFIMYNLASTVCITFMNISDMSLISFMTGNGREHGYLANAQTFGRNLGVLIGSSFVVKLLAAFSDKAGDENTQRGYTLTVVILCVFMLAANLIKVFTTKETEEGGASANAKDKRSLREDIAVFRTVLSDKNWLKLFILQVLNCVCMPLSAMGAAYYAMYALGDMGHMSWLVATQTGPTFAVLFFIPFLIKGFDKVWLTKAGAVLSLIGAIGFGLAAPAKPAMILFSITRGCGTGILICMLVGLTADSAEAIRRKSGTTVAGICYAGMTAGDKIGTGLGSVLLGAILAVAGFNGALDVQPAGVAAASAWVFVWSPVVIFVIVLIIVFFFGLDFGSDDETADLT